MPDLKQPKPPATADQLHRLLRERGEKAGWVVSGGSTSAEGDVQISFALPKAEPDE